MKSGIALLVVILMQLPLAAAENWPQWRGPEANGIAATGEYPIAFSATENVAWQVALPGRGSSTPAVWGEQVFVTCPIEGNDGVVCFDMQGQEQWRRSLGPERTGKHPNGTGSNPSPVTDGSHLVVYYKSGTLACLNLAGKVLWQKNLQEMYGKDTLWWDLGTSPVIADGKVVVAVMQGGDSYLAAFDLESGDVVWKQARQFDCQPESDQAYTTPVVRNVDGRDVIVTWGADHLTGHDLATGEPLWHCGGFNPQNEGMWRVIASPAVDNDLAIVPSGRGEFLAAVKLSSAQGDITASHRLWERAKLGADVPTPILDGGRVLLLTDRGKIYALDKQTGDEIWQDSLPKARANYFASPILAGDLLYCAREDGVVMVVRLAADGMQLLAENSLDESLIATPIPLRDKLLLRGETHLFLIAN